LTIRLEHFFMQVHRLLRVEKFSTFAFTATAILMSGGQRRLENLAFKLFVDTGRACSE